MCRHHPPGFPSWSYAVSFSGPPRKQSRGCRPGPIAVEGAEASPPSLAGPSSAVFYAPLRVLRGPHLLLIPGLPESRFQAPDSPAQLFGLRSRGTGRRGRPPGSTAFAAIPAKALPGIGPYAFHGA